MPLPFIRAATTFAGARRAATDWQVRLAVLLVLHARQVRCQVVDLALNRVALVAVGVPQLPQFVDHAGGSTRAQFAAPLVRLRTAQVGTLSVEHFGHLRTVREYFQILVDTLLGVFVEPFSDRRSRAVITPAPKFYLFDVGVAGYLTGRRIERSAGQDFGHALEHFVLMELLAYRTYRERDVPVRFWRTKSGLECDFVIGRSGEVVIEVKGSADPAPRDLTPMRAYVEEHHPRHAIVVCTASNPRRTQDGIWILPWEQFLERLWADTIIE